MAVGEGECIWDDVHLDTERGDRMATREARRMTGRGRGGDEGRKVGQSREKSAESGPVWCRSPAPQSHGTEPATMTRGWRGEATRRTTSTPGHKQTPNGRVSPTHSQSARWPLMRRIMSRPKTSMATARGDDLDEEAAPAAGGVVERGRVRQRPNLERLRLVPEHGVHTRAYSRER